MADFAYGDDYSVADKPQGGGVTNFLNWMGAALSLALIAGLASWGWQLLKRDVSGVPVITALEGPMRVAPENPGGMVAEHQGLAVNRIAAVGEAAPNADQVVLAPQPVELAQEDQPMAALLPETTQTASVEEPPVAELQNLSPTDFAVVSALAELDEDLLISDVTQATSSLTQSSPRPQQRPAQVTPAVQIQESDGAEANLVNVSSSSADALDPSAIPSGTRLVQLGAYPSRDEAEAAWSRIDTAFTDYMGGKSQVIQEAETGGKTFYRLRAAGFDDLSEARRFCAVLVAGDASCIPVVAR